MGVKQKYGIKYPFTTYNNEMVFMDLNDTFAEGIKSKVLHVIFTPKGSKLRDPEFGTNLVQFIFSNDEKSSLDDIKQEITAQIMKHVPQVEFRNIEIFKDEKDDNSIIVMVEYGVKKGNKTEVTTVGVKL
jgi:phage baseplate assembly protein W